MKVKSILSLAAANLGREDLVAAVNDCAGEPFGEVAALLRCYNLIENEIALDYFPLKAEEKVCSHDGSIFNTSLRFSPVEVLSVRDESGAPIEFMIRPARILLPHFHGDRQATVLYTYSPKEKCFCDCAEVDGRISARLLSFGVDCEFCLSNGQFSEAATWEKKFREALRAASIPRCRLSVRSRRWV